MNKKFAMNAGEGTLVGRIVLDLHMSGILDCLFTRDEHAGRIYEGGSHFLWLEIREVDLEVFFELIEEYYEAKGGRFAGGVAALKKICKQR